MSAKAIKRRKRVAKWRKAYSYRIPMQIRLYICMLHGEVYPVCPRCSSSLERDYILHCNRCGQKLGWDRLNEVCFIIAGDKERKIYRQRSVPLTALKNTDTERGFNTIPSNGDRSYLSPSCIRYEQVRASQPTPICMKREGVKCSG